jgi:hypothetical protein
MNLEEQLKSLYESGDTELQDLAVRANDLKNMLLTQQISKSEYLEMLNDLATEKNINETAHDLEVKIQVNAALTALVAIASAV